MKKAVSGLCIAAAIVLGSCGNSSSDSIENARITYIGLDQYYENPTVIRVAFTPEQLRSRLGKSRDSAFATNFTALLTYMSLSASTHDIGEFVRSLEAMGYTALWSTSPWEFDSVYIDGRLRVVTTMELHRKSDGAYSSSIQWDREYGVLSSEFGKNQKRFLTDFRIVSSEGITSQGVIHSYGRKQLGQEWRFFTRDSLMR